MESDIPNMIDFPADTTTPIGVHNDIKIEISSAAVHLLDIQQPIQNVCNAIRKLELSIDALCSLEDWIDSTCLTLSSINSQIVHLNESTTAYSFEKST